MVCWSAWWGWGSILPQALLAVESSLYDDILRLHKAVVILCPTQVASRLPVPDAWLASSTGKQLGSLGT